MNRRIRNHLVWFNNQPDAKTIAKFLNEGIKKPSFVVVKLDGYCDLVFPQRVSAKVTVLET